MATKADFTEDEWHALQKGVTGAGMLVSVSDADWMPGLSFEKGVPLPAPPSNGRLK
jgi:hypothetical protein